MRSKNLSEVDHKGINKIRDNQLDIDTSQLLPSKCNLPDLLPSNVKLCNQQHSISLAQQTHCLDRNMRHIESSNSEFNVFKEMFCDIEKDTEIFDENLPETLDQEFETVFCANNIQSDDKIFNHAKKECWSDKIVCEKLVEQNIHTENLIAPPTQETACQTDKNSVPIILKIENTTLNLTGLNRWGSMSEKYLEDTNLDIISRELRNQLSPSDKLHGILGNLTI